jgi:hypothetical protein
MNNGSEPKLTNQDEFQEAIRGIRVSKAPGANRIPDRALQHFSKEAVLSNNHFPSAWKHAHVISILQPGKDPAQPSSYRPISLLYTIGNLFEMILLTRILNELGEFGLLRGDQLVSDPDSPRPCIWPASLKG